MASDSGPEQQHFKSNYIEVIKRIVPEFYDETEYNLYGEEENLEYNVLAKILYTAKNLSSLIDIPVSSGQFGGSSGEEYSSIRFVPYFVPFNKISRVSPYDYEKHVLNPLGKSLRDFTNVRDFSSFIITSALPNTHLNQVTDKFVSGYSSIVDPAVSSVSAVQNELLDNLGWAYMLNTSGKVVDANSITLSSLLLSSINDDLYLGKNITESTGVSIIMKWILRNCLGGGAEWTQIQQNHLPPPFNAPSSTYSNNYFASGAQLVSALDTLVNVWVNEDDPNSLYFKDIVNASLLGLNVTRMENAGPMGKMLKALAYAFYDVKNTVRDIQFLLDIEECPEEFLQYLGRYLGWTFFTTDPAKWREQLKQAIYLYKAKGTRQALTNAIQMVIPSGLWDANNPTSGIQEMYESYVPNLIYYVIKTETEFGSSTEAYSKLIRAWNRSLAASGFNIKLTNYDSANPDNNARFLVDYILQYLNEKHDFIRFHGKSFKKSDIINTQVSAGVKQPGFFHRGKNVPIPPWEEHRFYQNTLIDAPVVRDLSTLMTRKVKDLGLNVSSSAAQSLSRYITSSTELTDTNIYNLPNMGVNLGFTFMSSALNLPYNYERIIRKGQLENMSLFDLWNSKSSTVNSKFMASSIDWEVDDFFNIGQTKLGKEALPAVIDIFRQFSPFHVLNKIFAGFQLDDGYFIGSALSDRTDFQIINTLQSDADQWNSSYVTSAFPGTLGTGIFSGIYPNITNPQQGRWVPSATLYTAPYFWSGGGPETVNVLPIGTKKNGNAPRSAGRRRSNKYKFIGWAYTRDGLNQPINTDLFTASGTDTARGLYASGFLPKAFNFSSQSYVTTSGSLSSVYSYYDSSGDIPTFPGYGGNTIKGYFPQRAIPDEELNVSGWNTLRATFGSTILHTLADIFARRGEEDSRWQLQTEESYTNFKWGNGMMLLHNALNDIFNGQLRNSVPAGTIQVGDKYGGGFNLIAHVFGPTLFNHAFNIPGTMLDSLSSIAYPEIGATTVSASHPSWSAVATTPAVLNDPVFVGTNGNDISLEEGILQANAINSYRHPLDIFERPDTEYFSNGMLLSGVETVAPNVNSMAVWNYRTNNAYNVDKLGPSGLTLIQRHTPSEPRETVRVRYPLDGNMNYSYNGRFKFPPRDDALLSKSLSSLAGWRMVDQYRASGVSKEVIEDTSVDADAKVTLVETYSSALNFVTLSCSGGGKLTTSSILGLKNNPSLATNSNPASRFTPANLRYLEAGRTYGLTLEASSNSGGTPLLTYSVMNKRANGQWKQILADGTGGTWINMTNDLSGNQVNPMFSGSYDAGKDWKTYSGVITVSSTFQKSDNHQLFITPMQKGTQTEKVTFGVRNVQFKEISPATDSFPNRGRVANKLLPNFDYKMKIRGQVAQLAAETPVNEELFVRLVVEQKPFVGNGYEDFLCRSWAFNFHTRRWEEAKTMNPEDEWLRVPFTAVRLNASGFQTESDEEFEFSFNTHNHRTPLAYRSRSVQGPSDGYFFSAGPVHDDQSVYYLELAKPIRSGEYNGITIKSVSLVNEVYNKYADDLQQQDFWGAFDFFDRLGNSKSSRDARDSSGTYYTSGGSRSEYLEYWGGSHSATNGVYGFQDKQH